MHEADALGFERMRTQRRDEFGGARSGEDERCLGAVRRVARRRRDELVERRPAFATCDTTAMIRALAAAAQSTIGRIRNDQVEGRGLKSLDALRAQIGAYRSHHAEVVERGVARRHLRKIRL